MLVSGCGPVPLRCSLLQTQLTEAHRLHGPGRSPAAHPVALCDLNPLMDLRGLILLKKRAAQKAAGGLIPPLLPWRAELPPQGVLQQLFPQPSDGAVLPGWTGIPWGVMLCRGAGLQWLFPSPGSSCLAVPAATVAGTGLARSHGAGGPS